MEDYSRIFTTTKSIAIVGLSDNPERPSYGVAEYLSRHFDIIPVNPKLMSWQGRKVYSDIKTACTCNKVDLVNIFRRSNEVLSIVEDLISLERQYRPSTIWMQLGVMNQDAASLARSHGIDVVMDSCIAVQHRLWLSMKQ